MMRRLGVVGGLVMALVFAVPALESHACAAEAAAAAEGLAFAVAPDHGEICPDCGPACAGACCHAPHMAIASDLSAAARHDVERPALWTHQGALAAAPPSGPDQPPRF